MTVRELASGLHVPPPAWGADVTAVRREQVEAEAAKRTVLIVEDEVLSRMVLAECLREHDLVVLEAATADEAIAILESPLPVDLVWTDVTMPGPVDGLGLARIVRSKHPRLKIVVSSAYLHTLPSPDLADAFFSKPYAVTAVVRRVMGLLAENRA